MRSNVEGTLLYGAMFLYLAPGYYETVVSLQLAFERALLGVAPWASGAMVRMIAGWRLNWGERVMLEVLMFRAELFSCSRNMLVRKVWSMAQGLPGNTFALASRGLLQELALPEIFDFCGWKYFLESGMSNLASYKRLVQETLETRSIMAWRVALASKGGCAPHLLAQQCPVSVGERLLEGGHLNMLYAATDFDKLRAGLVRVSVAGLDRVRACRLCHAREHGLAHVLGACPAVRTARQDFLNAVDRAWACQMMGAELGDWPVALLNPHMMLTRLPASVHYVSQIVQALQQ